MNLTCGRNPWKRASLEDSTFRAYIKNPKFLRSILPLSPELDSILRRVFEFNPRKRITTSELRILILRCTRFTTSPGAVLSTPLTPPPEMQYNRHSSYGPSTDAVNPFHHYPTVPCTPSPSSSSLSAPNHKTHMSSCSSGSSVSEDGSVYSNSSYSSEEYRSEQIHDFTQGPPQPVDNFYGTFIPLDSVDKNPGSIFTAGVDIAIS